MASANIEAGIAALEQNDAEAAAREFQASFEGGDPDGAFYLGRMFELGLGTEPSLQRAAELYQVAANQESALAMNRLGLMYFDGDVVIRDYARGAELICGAADKGEINAQFSCGAIYSEGKGLPQDEAKALDYWQKASDQGHIGSTNFLGQAYKIGKGVNVDPAKAFEYFSITADLGNAMGLFEVALALEGGIGTEVDKIQAYTYANIAAARAHPDGPALRDRLEAELNSDEIAQAQKTARDWIAAAEAKLAEQ